MSTKPPCKYHTVYEFNISIMRCSHLYVFPKRIEYQQKRKRKKRTGHYHFDFTVYDKEAEILTITIRQH